MLTVSVSRPHCYVTPRFSPVRFRLAAGLALSMLLATGVLQVRAQSSGGNFVLTKFAVAAGGESSSVGEFTVVTTAGQPAGVKSGGVFLLTGGFHQPAAVAAGSDLLFCDGFESNSCP